MKKKVIYPTCAVTVSGKHHWIELTSDECPRYHFIHPVCEYCEMVDDTVTLKQDQQAGKVAYS